LGKLLKREPHRDFWKVAYWPKPNDATARAIGLDVRITLGGELLDGGVKWIHPLSNPIFVSGRLLPRP
jgi:hypothetical protein